MATTKKRTWKLWVSRTLLLVLLIGSVWLINLIWFRPFSIGQFYDFEFVTLALRSTETITYLGVPISGSAVYVRGTVANGKSKRVTAVFWGFSAYLAALIVSAQLRANNR